MLGVTFQAVKSKLVERWTLCEGSLGRDSVPGSNGHLAVRLEQCVGE